jgi:cytochrome c556
MTFRALLTGSLIAAALLATAVQTLAGEDAASAFRQREDAMKRMGRALYSGIGRVVKGTAAYGPDTVAAAETIASLARTIATLFPAGSNVDDSRMLPQIVTAEDRVESLSATVERAAGQLVAVVKSGDKAAMAAAYATLKDDCEACHSQFRKAE